MKGSFDWKSVGVTAFAILIVIAGVALAYTRPWEQKTETAESEPKEGWREYVYTAFFELAAIDNREYVENVSFAAPFPDVFENLQIIVYSFYTGFSSTPRGNLDFYEPAGGVIENTLTVPPPSYVVENLGSVENYHIGYMAVIQNISIMYPKDVVEVHWRFLAPENTSLYDVPEENRVHVKFEWEPATTAINVLAHFELYYAEEYGKRHMENRGVTWWEWVRQPWLPHPMWLIGALSER